MFSVPIRAFEDKKFIKSCIKHLSKLNEVPKNTLKIKFVKRVIDYNGYDFMEDRKSVHTTYQVFIFNRNK